MSLLRRRMMMQSQSSVFTPYEADTVTLSESGTYYLTPIAYTRMNPTFLVSVQNINGGWPEMFIANEARRLFKITIDDAGVTVYTPDYDQWHPGKTMTYEGVSEVIFGAGPYGGYDIRSNPCVVTYRVDTDESQWGVGRATEITS